MRFVLDCSVSVPWYLDDERTPYSERILSSLPNNDPVAPLLWRSEFANAILVARRRRRITADRHAEILRQIEGLEVMLDQQPVAMSALTHLAVSYNLSAYDATYLELAQRLALPIATQDKALIKAAKACGVDLFK